MKLARRGAAALVAALITSLLGIAGPAEVSAVPAAASAVPTSFVRDCPAHPAPGQYTCYGLHGVPAGGAVPFTGGSPPGTLGPADLRAAYNLTSPSATGGKGQTVYVIDAYGYESAEDDLAVYRSNYGLPPCTVKNGCFRKVNQDGLSPGYLPDGGGWANETALDLDMVSAICPACHITLVQANTAGDDLFRAVLWATNHGAKYVSMSWGGQEDGIERQYDAAYFGKQGVAYVASSGDDGYDAGPSYPASSSAVVSVGGTSLHADASARGWSETVWGDSGNGGTGSGCSAFEPKPAWQHVVAAGTCARRAQNDVSAVADPATPVAEYFNGGWTWSGGTSVGAPIITSIYALAGVPAANRPGSYPYAATGALFDVVSGDNGLCSPARLCTAAAGWDGPTGLGTPNGTAAFLSPVSLPYPGAQESAVGLPVHVQLPVIASPSDSVTVTATGLPAGLSISAAGLITGSATTAGKTTVTATVRRGAVVKGTTGFSWTVGWAGQLTPVAPTRLLDTRTGLGAVKAKVPAGGSVAVQVLGRAGIPLSGVSSVVLNVTETQAAGTGFVTAYADGSARPGTSNLNFLAGDTVPNLVVAPVGADGKVRLYSSAGTHLVADAFGYYVKGTPPVPAGFTPLPPTRLLDTRSGLGAPAHPVTARTLHLAVAGRGGVPAAAGVSAVVLNVTATRSTATGWITAFPDGAPAPNASVLNFSAGRTVPNLVVVPVGADGAVNLGVNGAGSTDVLADVFGYYTKPAAPPKPGTYQARSPSRILDTRTGLGSGGHRHVSGLSAVTLHVPVTGASAVALNVTVTNASTGGEVTVYAGAHRPGTSNLNFLTGRTVANLVVVPVSPSGTVTLYVAGTTATVVDLIADLSGYFVLG